MVVTYPSDVFVWWVYGGFALVALGYGLRLAALRRALRSDEVTPGAGRSGRA